MKILIVGTQRDNISKAQWQPFFYSKKELKRQLDLTFQTMVAETCSEIEQVCKQNEADIFFINPFWKETSSEVEKAIIKIRQAKPQQKIVFIDPWDQVSSRYFNVLPYVDSFVKRQCYRDLEKYHQNFKGGTMFTDFLAQEWNFDLQGWDVSSRVPEGYLERIKPGWNLGTAKKFKRQIEKPALFEYLKPAKIIDIFCRISLGKSDDWYSRYRQISVEALKPLEDDYQVAISSKHQNNLVSHRQYRRELKRSKIVFSPFGWGEHCWRDIEAIVNNCLLVKPSMDHINTQPNFLIENETYVPVKWDYSDLTEKIEYYLQHWEEAHKIIEKANQVYHSYFQERKFIKTIRGIC